MIPHDDRSDTPVVESRAGCVLVIVATLLLGPMATLLATDIYVPSLPNMAQEFGVAPIRIQESISFSLFAFGVAHLLAGPLADVFGRRAVLLSGLALFVIASLAATIARSDAFFIAARLLQGAAAAAPSVTVVVLIRELFDDSRALRVMGAYGVVIGTMPAIGPILGGHLDESYGWQAGFLIVAGLGSAALLSTRLFVPATGEQLKGPIRLSAIVGDYVRLLARTPFMACAAIGGLMFAGLYAFVTAAPFALIEARGVSPASYGLYQGLAVTGYMLGATTTALLAGRIHVRGLLALGLASGLSGGAFFLALAESGILESIPELIVLAIGVFVFGLSIIVATTPILAFSFVDDINKGTAAAVLSGMHVFGGGLGAHIVRSFDGTEFRTLAFALIGAAILAALTYVGGVVRSATRSVEEEQAS